MTSDKRRAELERLYRQRVWSERITCTTFAVVIGTTAAVLMLLVGRAQAWDEDDHWSDRDRYDESIYSESVEDRRREEQEEQERADEADRRARCYYGVARDGECRPGEDER